MLLKHATGMRWWGWASCELSCLEPIGTYVSLGLGYVRRLWNLTVSVCDLASQLLCWGAQPLWGAACALPVCKRDSEGSPYLPAARFWRSFWWLKWLARDDWCFSSGEKLGFLFRVYFFHVPWNSISFTPVKVINGTRVTSSDLDGANKDNTKFYLAAKVRHSLTRSCMFRIL